MTATTIEMRPGRSRVLRYPISVQFARDLAYVTLTLATSIVAFTAVIVGLSVSATFVVLIVGLPVIVGVAYANRGLAGMQRRLSGWVLGERILPPYKEPVQRGVLGRIMAVLTDPQTWRDLAWMGFDALVGFTIAVIAVSTWGTVLGSLLLPAWWWSMPEDAMYLWMAPDTTAATFVGPLVGLGLLPIALAMTRGFALGHARVAAALLGPGSRERVEQLTESRAGAVDAAHAELQRIERDLHDGAQARLVALAMDLGMAERKVSEDPQAGRELIGEARAEALRALGELRELVRGIGPSILRDRGLEAAIASLTAGRAQGVDFRVDIGDPRPTDVQEATAYFVVAEALANAAKHAGAALVRVRVWRSGHDEIVVEVTDDGRGGADPGAGTGLRGLSNRVAAIDGRLAVSSPPGGPTKVRAEIPCG